MVLPFNMVFAFRNSYQIRWKAAIGFVQPQYNAAAEKNKRAIEFNPIIPHPQVKCGVAQASCLQTRCLRYVIHQEKALDNHTSNFILPT